MHKLFFALCALLVCLPFAMTAQKPTPQPSKSKPVQPQVEAPQVPATAPAPAPTPAAGAKMVTLTCKIIDMPANVDSLSLYEGAGMAMRQLQRVGRGADSNFVFKLPAAPQSRFYGVGLSQLDAGYILLGTEPNVTIWANANYMNKARAVNSAVNRQYEQVARRCTDFNTMETQLQNDFRAAVTPPNKPLQQQITAQAEANSKAKAAFLDSLKRASPMLWRTATLLLQPEYLGDNKGRHAGFVDFYGKEGFAYANWAEKSYAEQPHVVQAFNGYTKRLLELGADEKQLKQYLDQQLARVPAGTYTHRMALSGVVGALKELSHSQYPIYAKKYVDAYRNDSYGEIGPLEFDLNKNATFTPGMPAPDLVGQTPDGGSLALSQLKGKYVLIDFWASWCGPCRRENPNVVANYKKYKDKGFEIFGVSLDKNADAWKKAIQDDGLTWQHISDLKGWSSDHARLYSVSSIPQTVLIDKEGKIVQRNLRGEQLTAKLQELLGE